MSNLRIEPRGERGSEYELFYGSQELPLAHLYRETDGYYVLDFNNGQGYLPEWFFREVAEILRTLNEPWQIEMESYFAEQEAKK